MYIKIFKHIKSIYKWWIIFDIIIHKKFYEEKNQKFNTKKKQENYLKYIKITKEKKSFVQIKK